MTPELVTPLNNKHLWQLLLSKAQLLQSEILFKDNFYQIIIYFLSLARKTSWKAIQSDGDGENGADGGGNEQNNTSGGAYGRR